MGRILDFGCVECRVKNLLVKNTNKGGGGE